jgi:hypothetical protein
MDNLKVKCLPLGFFIARFGLLRRPFLPNGKNDSTPNNALTKKIANPKRVGSLTIKRSRVHHSGCCWKGQCWRALGITAD